MLKLDRTVFNASKITDVKKEATYYKHATIAEMKEAFAYLQSVAFNYPLHHTPKMDKTIFSTRKLNG